MSCACATTAPGSRKRTGRTSSSASTARPQRARCRAQGSGSRSCARSPRSTAGPSPPKKRRAAALCFAFASRRLGSAAHFTRRLESVVLRRAPAGGAGGLLCDQGRSDRVARPVAASPSPSAWIRLRPTRLRPRWPPARTARRAPVSTWSWTSGPGPERTRSVRGGRMPRAGKAQPPPRALPEPRRSRQHKSAAAPPPRALRSTTSPRLRSAAS